METYREQMNLFKEMLRKAQKADRNRSKLQFMYFKNGMFGFEKYEEQLKQYEKEATEASVRFNESCDGLDNNVLMGITKAAVDEYVKECDA